MSLFMREYPILEFDDVREAILEPSNFVKPDDVPRRCVIAYFRDAIAAMQAEGLLRPLFEMGCEMADLPVYELNWEGERVALALGFVGAPGAAAELEELIAHGMTEFVVCGGAGVLRKDIAVGRLIIPRVALRDEGTSYHYLPPAREVECDPVALAAVEGELTRRGIPYLDGKTWTTDAFYRETRDKVNLRVAEGCVSVEMEAAAYFAVARFRGVRLAQILYGGDDLSGEAWDGREWNDRTEIRRNLIEISLSACAKMPCVEGESA